MDQASVSQEKTNHSHTVRLRRDSEARVCDESLTIKPAEPHSRTLNLTSPDSASIPSSLSESTPEHPDIP